MKEQVHEEPRIMAAAERKMQAWAMSEDIATRTEHDAHNGMRSKTKEYIAISRESGACGTAIAEMVGRQLSWDVLDKALLDEVADTYHLSRPGLEVIDETATNWAYDILGTWLDSQMISHEKYCVYFERTVRIVARRQHAIFLGRGAQFFLPRDRGYAVRIIAPESYRVEQIMQRYVVTKSKALHIMREADRGRRGFVKHFCHYDITDPHSYDAVYNLAHTPQEEVADQIVDAVRHRFAM